jgi:hypothetical protein
MENYISYFKTEQEYNQSIEDLSYPNVSYVEETDTIHYNKQSQSYVPLRIWVDDFPEGCDCLEEIDEFIADPDFKGSNGYDSMNQTMEIDGVEYCMWECSNDDNCSNEPYLLTTTYDYGELYNQSMEKDQSNEFTAFYSMINSDGELYNVLDSEQKLVKVIKL